MGSLFGNFSGQEPRPHGSWTTGLTVPAAQHPVHPGGTTRKEERNFTRSRVSPESPTSPISSSSLPHYLTRPCQAVPLHVTETALTWSPATSMLLNPTASSHPSSGLPRLQPCPRRQCCVTFPSLHSPGSHPAVLFPPLLPGLVRSLLSLLTPPQSNDSQTQSPPGSGATHAAASFACARG